MKHIKSLLSVSPYKRRLVSAKGLVKTVNTEREKIKTIKFIPPKIGSESLGKFYVELEDYTHNGFKSKR